MTIRDFSAKTQEGLSRWAWDRFQSEGELDRIGDFPAAWAWIFFLLREAEDRDEWFPRGKWATLQILEERLIKEAREHYRPEGERRYAPLVFGFNPERSSGGPVSLRKTAFAFAAIRQSHSRAGGRR